MKNLIIGEREREREREMEHNILKTENIIMHAKLQEKILR